MRSTRSIALLLALVLPAAAQLPAPTGASFAKGAKFTVAGYTNANGTARSELTCFPVLVRLAANSPSGFSYDDLTSSTGDDLCFIDMDGNGLPFEIDEWHSDGTSLVWVRLPTMENGTEFVMCWGGGTSGKTVCNDNPWNDYVGVWHMSEASGTVADSTANSLDAVPGGTTANSIAVDGKVGKARQNAVSGSAGNLTVPNYSSVYNGTAFTVSGWFYQTEYNSNDSRLFSRKSAWDVAGGWETFSKYDKNNKVGGVLGMRGRTKDATYQSKSSIDLKVLGWTHLTFAYNGTTTTMYTNGVAVSASGSINGTTASDSSLGIGAYNGVGNASFFGYVDECRLLKATASGDWAAAEYASMADAAFLSAGEAQSYGGTFPPAVSVSVTDRQYTNASFTVSVGSLGTGATQADVSAMFAATDDFANPLWTTNYTVQGVGAQSVSLAGLATGTTYYMQAQIVNDQNVTNTSPVVTLATLTPGAPAGTATFDERGFSTLAATGTTTAFGTGGESAAMRLEASTDGFETVAAFSPEVVAALGESAPLTISGLSPGTAYALRLRITNNWGVAATVALPDVSTRAVPFATTGLGWTFSADGSTVDITFGVSGVYDGATGSASLTYGGAPVDSPKAVVIPGPTWTTAALQGPATATVVVSATLDGQTYEQTFAATISPGSTAVSVGNVADHMSAATAVRVHAGDVVTLPELSGTACYLVGNRLFGSLAGNVLTALRPGILGIHCVGNDGATNTLAVLVLPEKIDNGDIYIYKEKSVSNHSCNWKEAKFWEKLGSETNDSWPNGADDIAIIPYYDETGVQFNLQEDIILGGLYAGRWKDAAGNISIRSLSSPVHGIAFERTDGEPARIQLCPNSPLSGDNNFRAKLTIDQSIPSIAFHADTIISGGSDRMGATYPQGRFDFNAQLFDIAEGATVSLVEMDTHQTGSAVATMTGGRLTGGGTFWNRSAAAVRFSRNKETFAGLLRDSGGYGHVNGDRCGPTEVRSISTNCTAEAVGWIGVDSSSQPRGGWNQSVGCIYLGNDHGHGKTQVHAGTNWFPRIATLHGGRLHLCPEQTAWGAPGVLDRKYAQRLVLADGFCYLRAWSRDTSGGWPVNWFEADELGHENKATLRIDDDSRKSTASTATITNQATFLRGWASAAVGPAGDPESSDSYPTIPWIVSPLDGGYNTMYFSAFDSAGRLVRPALAANNTALSAFSAGRNAYCRNAGIALTEDLTVNSLYLQNDTKGKTLGAGRTLTVTSGGLILSDVNDNNNPGAAAIGEEGGAENGTLILGDADHPAYVWAYGSTTSSANTAPNQIWAPVTAPGGFVMAYTGHLVLGGNQTNILDELVVNAGSLTLGSATTPCRLAKNLPIRIYANATLKLPNADSTGGKLLYFDGAAGWFGKVEIAEGVAAQVKKAFVRDYPESPEWEALPRGFYGSSESGVEALATVTHPAFVRDDLFSGTGTLKVVADDRIPPTLMILR